MYVGEFPFDKFLRHNLQPTGQETPLQIPFGKCLGSKECSNISKISNRSLCKTTPFSLTRQAGSLKFLASTKSYPKKKFSCDCSLNSCKFTRKRPIMKPFYWSNSITMSNLQGSEKNRFIHFPEDAQKSRCFERFRKILEKCLFRQSNISSINILKTVSPANVSCEFSWKF